MLPARPASFFFEENGLPRAGTGMDIRVVEVVVVVVVGSSSSRSSRSIVVNSSNLRMFIIYGISIVNCQELPVVKLDFIGLGLDDMILHKPFRQETGDFFSL